MKTIPMIYNNELTVAEEKIKRHESLLHKIACSFGLSNTESWELVQQVCLQGYKHYSIGKICYPLKVWLVRDIVHQCIFEISRKLFSQLNKNDHSAYLSVGGYHLSEMSLSYKTVYILSIQFQFNEVEVAEILNITPLKVKERLNIALSLVK